MNLKCLNGNCNKDNNCQTVYLYVNCFKINGVKADEFILNYFKNKDKLK